MELIEREVLLKHKFGIYENEDEDGNALSYPRFSGKHAVSEEDILSAPAIDAAPVVHGRWKTKRGNYITGGGDPLWECSQCGHIYGASLLPPKYHFCPNCGARMGGKGHG